MVFLTEGFPVLSRSARDFVRRRPRDARLAVAVALEAAAVQSEAEDRDADEVPEGLRPFVLRRGGGEDIIGVSEAAARLGVSRTTVYNWTARGTLLAWKSTRRGLSIPAAQILGPGNVVGGAGRSRQGCRRPRACLGVSHPGMAVRRGGGAAA